MAYHTYKMSNNTISTSNVLDRNVSENKIDRTGSKSRTNQEQVSFDHRTHQTDGKYDDNGVDLTKLNKPPDFGPGLWFAIHTTAKEATSLEDKKSFIKWIQRITESIKCSECRGHAIDYVATHPIEPYFNIYDDETGIDVGMFKWSWIFHNTVNFRLNKPWCSWETAMSLFYESDLNFKPCDENCGSSHVIKEPILVSTSASGGSYQLAQPLYFRTIMKHI